jgi:tetratricopeptide (TPR) repeat protein
MRPSSLLAALAAVAAGLMMSSGALAAVSVLGGGLAHDCSLAARDGRSDRAAIELCTLALDSEPLAPRERAGTFINRGVIKLRMRDWASAKADFDYAIREDGQLGEAYVNRGAAFIALKRYPEGLADLDRGIALGPEEPEKAWYNRGLVHEKLDDMKSAYFDYHKALELKPDWDMPQKELKRFTVSEVGG